MFFPQQSLSSAIAHNKIIIFKNRIQGKNQYYHGPTLNTSFNKIGSSSSSLNVPFTFFFNRLIVPNLADNDDLFMRCIYHKFYNVVIWLVCRFDIDYTYYMVHLDLISDFIVALYFLELYLDQLM